MQLIEKFSWFISQKCNVRPGDRILLAVSGGKDSMLMLHFFRMIDADIIVAHCNFSLRAEESDKDEQLVREYCSMWNIPIQVRRFDTLAYGKDHKISIQMAARDMRYDWFDELATRFECKSIAIAQHKNDHVETVLLNMTRGTGLLGMQGIHVQRGRLIRPLLFMSVEEIGQAIKEMNIPYRDDASNFSTKYARNKIRLDIIPQFEQLQPDFIDIMDDNIRRFQESYAVLQDLVKNIRDTLFVPAGGGQWKIAKSVLKEKSIGLLYLLFEPYQFSKSVLEDMFVSFDKESGRCFESRSYLLLVDREDLVLKKRNDLTEEAIVQKKQRKLKWLDMDFEIYESDNLQIKADPMLAKLDVSKLVFPLYVRSWQEGDSFVPLGMKGKKKVSDFFIGRKVNVFEKSKVPIWVNGNGDILWITGYQIDDRYKITENTQKVLTLVCRKEEI